MPNGGTTGQRPTRDMLRVSGQQTFSADEIAEARLLATFPTDRNRWDQATTFRVSNFRTFSIFFCPSMQLLKRRSKTIERTCKDHLTGVVAERRYLSMLSAGDPVTLDKILEVARALDAIAASNEPHVREVTLVNYHGTPAPLQLHENSVIPSHLWPDRTLLHEFRKHFRISRNQLGELLFGDAGHADNFIDRLEEGDMFKTRNARELPTKPDGAEKSSKRLYDYRVTPFTADCIYLALKTIFDRLTHLHTGPFPVLPSQSKFFIASHTAGEGSGRRTLALPISNGNLMAPLKPEEARAMVARIDDYALRRGQT